MRNIINFKKLAQNSLRRKALLIAEAGYEAIEIEKVIKKRIKLRGNKLKIVHSHILENVGINKNLEKNVVNAELDRLGMEIDLNNFKIGDQVQFILEKNKENSFIIIELKKM